MFSQGGWCLNPFYSARGSCDKEEAFSEVKRNMVLEEVSRGRKSKIEDESSSETRRHRREDTERMRSAADATT